MIIKNYNYNDINEKLNKYCIENIFVWFWWFVLRLSGGAVIETFLKIIP